MRPLLLAFALLPASLAAHAQAAWTACQAYANLAAAQDAGQLRAQYQPLAKSFVVRAIYAERLYAFHDDNADATLLNNLPANGQQLQDFYHTADCASLGRPVAHLDALAGSYNSYFIDEAQAVVRHPEFMRQFLLMYTQFHHTPVDNVDLAEQMCPVGVYVYLHNRDALLAALPAAHVSAEAIPHSYQNCP